MNDPGSLLRALFAAGDAGALDSMDDLLDAEVVVHAPFGLSETGLEREKESWRRAKAAIPDLYHEFLDVVVDGDRVAARCRVTGTMNGTYGSITARGRSFAESVLTILAVPRRAPHETG